MIDVDQIVKYFQNVHIFKRKMVTETTRFFFFLFFFSLGSLDVCFHGDGMQDSCLLPRGKNANGVQWRDFFPPTLEAVRFSSDGQSERSESRNRAGRPALMCVHGAFFHTSSLAM